MSPTKCSHYLLQCDLHRYGYGSTARFSCRQILSTEINTQTLGSGFTHVLAYTSHHASPSIHWGLPSRALYSAAIVFNISQSILSAPKRLSLFISCGCFSMVRLRAIAIMVKVTNEVGRHRPSDHTTKQVTTTYPNSFFSSLLRRSAPTVALSPHAMQNAI